MPEVKPRISFFASQRKGRLLECRWINSACQLQELHQALGNVDDLDQDTARSLQQVAGAIEQLLHERQQGAEAVAEPGDNGPLQDDVQSLILKFEAEHPHLTKMLSDIATTLGNLGI